MGNLQPSALQRAKASLPPTACGRGKPLGEVWALVQFCSPVTLGQAPPFCTVSKLFFQEASQWNKQDLGWNQCLGLASFYLTVIFTLRLAGSVLGWEICTDWSSQMESEPGRLQWALLRSTSPFGKDVCTGGGIKGEFNAYEQEPWLWGPRQIYEE